MIESPILTIGDQCIKDDQCEPASSFRASSIRVDVLNSEPFTDTPIAMNFLDGHLYPENQQPLIITAAPYAPSWVPSDFPEDIPVTMEQQIQKAVDCYNAGATVLHLHVRE